jgi:trk system potassium uptake protein TrkH
MGVLVLILAVLPLSGSYNMHLMRAESPGPSVGKLVPKVKKTAMILYSIYISMTVAQVIALVIAGLPVYDALTMSFSTMGTGGFGIANSSAADYTMPVQTILMIFMLLCGVNFNIYYLFMIKKPKEVLQNGELRLYLILIFGAAIAVCINVRHFFDGIGEAFFHSLFQVVSIITTTGLSTLDYMIWPQFAKMVIFLLILSGACAGSTGGGFKVSRLIILFRTVQNELLHVVHPKSVKKVKYDGHLLDGEVTKSVQVYLAIYVMVFLGSTLLVSLDGFEFSTNMSAVAACLNNVGPGFNEVGPAGNFSIFSPFVKYVFMFDMLVGRLELIPLLILLNPKTWKKS